MYGWLFRHLPGPTWFKVIEALALLALVVVVLFQWVYPAANEKWGGDMTVDTEISQSAELPAEAPSSDDSNAVSSQN